MQCCSVVKYWLNSHSLFTAAREEPKEWKSSQEQIHVVTHVQGTATYVHQQTYVFISEHVYLRDILLLLTIFLLDKHASPGTSGAPTDVAKPRLTFHCLNLKELSDKKRRELHQKLYAESEDMMYKFQELFTSTTDSLRRRNIPVKELIRHLECLGQLKPTFDDSGEPAFRHQFPEL